MIAAERETVVAYSDDNKYVNVYTCRRPDITALNKKLDSGVELLREGVYRDGTIWAEYRIPMKKFSIAKAVRFTRTMTDEQREVSRVRLAAAREARA